MVIDIFVCRIRATILSLGTGGSFVPVAPSAQDKGCTDVEILCIVLLCSEANWSSTSHF